MFARFFDYTGQLMPGHMGQDHIGVVSHPTVPVAAADTGGFYADDNTILFRCGIGYILDAERLGEGFKYGSFHEELQVGFNWQ